MAKEILVTERNLPTVLGYIKKIIRKRDFYSISNFVAKKQKELYPLYLKTRGFQRIGSGSRMIMQIVYNKYDCIECSIKKNDKGEHYISFLDDNNNEITILTGEKIYFICDDIFVNKKNERFTQVLRTQKKLKRG